jgi:rRNA-processing protein FCF1
MGDLRLSGSDPIRLLIMDACVLIDYINSEPDLFQMINSHIGQIYVVTPVIEEVDSIESVEELQDFDLEVLEPDVEDLFEAGSMTGRTSFQDNICYLTAKRHDLVCVTNDKNLRSLCGSHSVSILWGLELILNLVAAGGMTRQEASEIGKKIHESNPKHISKTVLGAFLAKLK